MFLLSLLFKDAFRVGTIQSRQWHDNEADGEMKKLLGNPKCSEEPCPTPTLFTTNPTGRDLGTRLLRRDGVCFVNEKLHVAQSLKWLDVNT